MGPTATPAMKMAQAREGTWVRTEEASVRAMNAVCRSDPIKAESGSEDSTKKKSLAEGSLETKGPRLQKAETPEGEQTQTASAR